MKRLSIFLILLAIAPSFATAQVPASNGGGHDTEIAAEYNYVRSNAPPGDCDCFSLDGGSVSIAQPLGSGHLAAAFDASVTHGSGISASGYDLTLSSFTVGARYRPWLHARWNPFGQVLVGLVHSSGTVVEGSNPGAANAGAAFASNIGGGLDLKANRRFAIRLIEADYLLTTVDNSSNNHQNNLRISAGVVLRFGSK